MRPIDADALIEKCGDWYVEEGTESGFIGTLKNLLSTMPTVQHEKAQLSKEGTTKDATSDLISRQAAIDAIANCTNCENEKTLREYATKHSLENGWTGGVLDALDAVKDLPPAQPEPQWIPVEKELPEPRIDVWVNSDLGQMVGYYDEMVDLWYGRDYLELIVNAWMPLPEAYKPNK